MAITFIRNNIGESTNNRILQCRCTIYIVIGFGEEIQKVQMDYKMRKTNYELLFLNAFGLPLL